MHHLRITANYMPFWQNRLFPVFLEVEWVQPVWDILDKLFDIVHSLSYQRTLFLNTLETVLAPYP